MIPPLHSIGRVAGKHGFNGEVSIVLHKGNKAVNIKKGNFLFIEFDGKGVPFLVEQYKSQSAIIKLTDINSVEEAAELEGKTLWLEGAASQPEFTGLDLRGFSLEAAGRKIGEIASVESYPAGEMLLIRNGAAEILIPLVEDWILGADSKTKNIVMDLPEGLLDLES
jgi:16S rRNA processing protein RimM